MILNRRTVSFGLAATVLSACTGRRAPAPKKPEPRMQAVANSGYDTWVAAFQSRAASGGIAPSTLNVAFRNAGYLPDVIERDRNQTEFTRTLEDYLAIAASDDRIRRGTQSRHRCLGA
jgi:peptidoglycan lytic transglycosylase B